MKKFLFLAMLAAPFLMGAVEITNTAGGVTDQQKSLDFNKTPVYVKQWTPFATPTVNLTVVTSTPTGSATPTVTLTLTPSPTPTPPSGPQYVKVSVLITNLTPVVMVVATPGKSFHPISVYDYPATPGTANSTAFSTQGTPMPGCGGSTSHVLDGPTHDWDKTNSGGELTASESVSAPWYVNVWGYWTAP